MFTSLTGQTVPELMDQLKNEYGQVIETAQTHRGERNVFEKKLAAHSQEVKQMHAVFVDLELNQKAVRSVYGRENERLKKMLEAGGVQPKPFNFDETVQRYMSSMSAKRIRFDVQQPSNHEPFKVTCYASDGYSAVAVPRVAAAGWSLSSVEPVHTIKHDAVVCCARFNHTSSIVATGSQTAARLYRVDTGQCVGSYELNTPYDATMVAPQTEGSSSREIESAKAKTGAYVRSVHFSRDSKYFFVAGETPAIRVFDLETSRLERVLEGHKEDVYTLSINSDSSLVASGSADASVIVWSWKDHERGRKLRTLKNEDPSRAHLQQQDPTFFSISSVDFSYDNEKLVVGSQDSSVMLWDIETGKLIHRWQGEQADGHQDSVYSVAFASNGLQCVSGSLDKTLKVWDVNSDRAIATLEGHKEFVLSVAITNDSRFIVSGGKDKAVGLWEWGMWSRYASISGHNNSVIAVALSKENNYLCTAGGDMKARVWQLQYDDSLGGADEPMAMEQ